MLPLVPKEEIVDMNALWRLLVRFFEMIECLCVAFMTWFVIDVNISAFWTVQVELQRQFFSARFVVTKVHLVRLVVCYWMFIDSMSMFVERVMEFCESYISFAEDWLQVSVQEIVCCCSCCIFLMELKIVQWAFWSETCS